MIRITIYPVDVRRHNFMA